jgi:cytoskeletal protein CcmA (bactofilin family)
LGEAGSVEGSIEADAVEIRGRVRGAIAARIVRLHASADVDGDITHAELAIDAGARFTGRSLRLDPTPAIAALPAAAE